MGTLEREPAEIKAAWDKVNGLIAEFAIDPDVKKIVADIEGGMETTQYHYGDYMAALSPYAKKGPMALHILSKAMVKAGGDPDGIAWAVKLLKGGN